MDVIEKAIAIARNDLRWCYRERGIISGSRLVYWSWDSFFASFGAVRLGDTAIVKTNLDLYLGLQRADGNIPKRIAHPLYWMKFIKIPIREIDRNQRPNYWNSYYTAQSLTQNPTLVIALHDYVTYSGDSGYFKLHRDKIEKVFAYLKANENRDGLLWEGMGGGWAESVLKRGTLSFTNICYARAYACMAELCQIVGDGDQAAHYQQGFERIKRQINLRLWSAEDGGYYSDWYDHRRHHHFATDGNLMAILWNIADSSQADSIQAKIKSLALEDDIPIRLSYDKYDFWRICIYSRLGGVKDYHVGFSWTWLGCVDALAKHQLGRTEEAVDILRRIAEVIVRDGTVHETYDKNKAVHTFFYKSESPWGWGAGLFLYACQTAGFKLS